MLIAAPGADVSWEHHPSHFWLVLLAGVASAVSQVKGKREPVEAYVLDELA